MALGKIAEVNEEKPLFRLSFLKDNRAQHVEVEEIDFEEIERHLEQGESVLITPRQKQKPNIESSAHDGTTDPWYFTHI